MTRRGRDIAAVAAVAASLAVFSLAAAGCKRKSADAPAPDAKPAGAHAQPHHAFALPPAVPLTAIGVVAPAPWLDGARRVAAVPDGNRRVIVSAGLGWVKAHLPDGSLVAQADAVGAAQLIEIIDINGDGRPEIAVAHGLGKDALDAPVSLRLFPIPRAAEPWKPIAEIPLPETNRAQIVDLAPRLDRPGSFYLGMFTSKYEVAVLEVERVVAAPAQPAQPAAPAEPAGPAVVKPVKPAAPAVVKPVRPAAPAEITWTVTPRHTVRMALALELADLDGDGASELLVARPYGDELEQQGDVFALAADGKRTRLPSTRGARALTSWRGAAIYSDGWHRRYGTRARALITRTWREEGTFRSQILVRVENRVGYDRLRIGDLDGDHMVDVVAAGNGPAVAVLGMKPVTDAVPALGTVDALDAFPIDLTGDRRDEVILVGSKPGIWRLGGAPPGAEVTPPPPAK